MPAAKHVTTVLILQVGSLKDVFLFDMGKGEEKVDEKNILKWIEMNNALKDAKHVSNYSTIFVW